MTSLWPSAPPVSRSWPTTTPAPPRPCACGAPVRRSRRACSPPAPPWPCAPASCARPARTWKRCWRTPTRAAGALPRTAPTPAAAPRLARAPAPEAPGMLAASATLALPAGNLRQAGKHLETLLEDRDPRGWRYASVALNGGRDPQATARVLDRLVKRGAIPDD